MSGPTLQLAASNSNQESQGTDMADQPDTPARKMPARTMIEVDGLERRFPNPSDKGETQVFGEVSFKVAEGRVCLSDRTLRLR